MPTNPYFNNFYSTPEQRLVEDLMIETIKINGVDCFYLPNDNDDARDLLYGEDPLKKFTSYYPLEVYITNVDGYEGEREFFSKFGLEIRNQMHVIVSKRTFLRWIPADKKTRPEEGDLIYIPFLSQRGELYEIKYVDYSDAFYVLGNKYPYFYKLSLEKFKYSQEEISVGHQLIDELPGQDAYAQQFYFTTGTGDFTVDERVYQGSSLQNSTASATVAEWDLSDKMLKVTNIKGVFNVNSAVIGANSAASWSNFNYDAMADNQIREMTDNKIIQVEANNVVVVTEINPLGSIT